MGVGMLTRLAIAVLLVLAVAPARGAERPQVYLIVVDGLDARAATADRMPHLFGLLRDEPAHTSVFARSRAVMPTRTNSNHATLVTGVYPELHGITGNSWWNRVPGAPVAKLDDAARIEVETLFTVAHEATPAVATLGAFAKSKLVRLLGAAAEHQRAPDRLWSPSDAPESGLDPVTRYATDAATMDGVLAKIAEAPPDLTVVNLADVDRNGHADGPDSEAYAAAITGADTAIGRLIAALRAAGRWERSVLFVTSDHGFADVAPTSARPAPVVSLGRALAAAGVDGVHVVGDGGVEHVYGDGVRPGATEVGADGERLARVAAIARKTTGVAEVLVRLPVPGVPGLAAAHPDWHVAHERMGDLIVVAAPGYQLIDPWDDVDAHLKGNHGAPGELEVPLVVSGGSPALRAAPAGTDAPGAVDVAPTIVALLGLRAPRRIDGSPVPAALAGRPIRAVLSAPVR
jgi:hypothetical protein